MTKTRTTIDLSPEARAALKLPLHAETLGHFHDAQGRYLGYIWPECCGGEIAAFIAALVNEALTPAAPAVTLEPETNTELRQFITTVYEAHLCGDANCENYALTGSPFCAMHQVDAEGVTLAERLERR